MEPAFSAEASGSMSSPPPPPPEKDESSSSSSTAQQREAEDTAATAVAMATSGDGGGDASKSSAATGASTKKKPRTWKDELIEPECQFCRDTRAALMGLVKGTAGAAGGAANRGIDAATGVAGSVRKGTRAARERVERFVSTGMAHAADAEERAFEALKGKERRDWREQSLGIDRSMAVVVAAHVERKKKLEKKNSKPRPRRNRFDQVRQGKRAPLLRRGPGGHGPGTRPSAARGPVASDFRPVPFPRGRARLCRLARRGGGRGGRPRRQGERRGLGVRRGGPREA